MFFTTKLKMILRQPGIIFARTFAWQKCFSLAVLSAARAKQPPKFQTNMGAKLLKDYCDLFFQNADTR